MFNQKFSQQALFFIGFMLIIASCRKDTTTFDPYTNGQSELDYLLSFVPNEQAKSVFILKGTDLLHDTMLTTAHGVRVKLENNDFLFTLENGTSQPCSSCNTVKVEITEVLTTGEWLSRRLPANNALGLPQDHISAVHISISCDANALVVAPSRHLKIYLPSGATTNNFEVAYAALDAAKKPIHWEAGAPNSVFNATWSSAAGTNTYEGFELLGKKMGWITAIRPYTPNAFISFCVNLPIQFDESNTRVFALFNDDQVSMELVPDGNGGTFCLENAPKDKNVHFVTISKAGKQYWLGDLSSYIASDVTVKITPTTSTDQNIIAFIRGL